MLYNLPHPQRVKLSTRKKNSKRPRKDGEGHVTRLVGYYLVAYDPLRTPTRIERSLGTKSKRQANRTLDLVEDYVKAGKLDLWNRNSRLPMWGQTVDIAKAVDDYLVHKRTAPIPSGKLMEPSTHFEYTKLLKKQFVPWIEESLGAGALLQDISTHHVEAFVFKHSKKRNGQPNKPGTHNTQLSRICCMLQWFVDMGWLFDNPAAGIKRPKGGRKTEFFTIEQYVGFLRWLRAREKENAPYLPEHGYSGFIGAVILGAEVGLRRKEICSLTWGNVDLVRRVIHVRKTESFRPKNGLDRTVALRGQALALLTELSAKGPAATDAVLPGTLKGPLTPGYLSTTFKRLGALAGLPDGFSFHTTRHSHGRWLRMVGASMPQIGGALGHVATSSTEIYAHASGEDAAAYVDRIAALIAEQL